VPVSAHESNFAPIAVCILKALAIKPSRISVIKLIVIKIENKFSLCVKMKYRITGNTIILYRVIAFGIVQKV
jgi:hypothetical protein